ncbi:MAG TPA: 2-dehydro-3-deoxygalactonokinase [Geminicoccaceae bacterium]|nr:2-dehydro-3-deoxygalactonokinase [Geminicoccaceae bacterium]
MTAAALIGIDWGTSSFRAHRIDAAGKVLETREAAAGILAVRNGDFEAVLTRETGAWRAAEPGLPMVASGMITSRQGWLEVPYCPCPAGSAEIAAALMRHPDRPELHFVPGLSLVAEGGVPDVMRGEETQIVGEVGDRPGRHLLVLPGTHSKWALAEHGLITWFATFMTGEVFAVLKEHSILGRLMHGESEDPTAFERGLTAARDGKGGLLKRLFSARTLGLFDLLPATGIAAYLSGLLIGSEIEEALACLDAGSTDIEIRVIGGSQLARRYQDALAARDLRVPPAREHASARGQFLIARAAGLIA